jgi:hypothetical protein
MEMLNLTRSRFQVQEKREAVGRWEQITQDSVHSVVKMVMVYLWRFGRSQQNSARNYMKWQGYIYAVRTSQCWTFLVWAVFATPFSYYIFRVES